MTAHLQRKAPSVARQGQFLQLRLIQSPFSLWTTNVEEAFRASIGEPAHQIKQCIPVYASVLCSFPTVHAFTESSERQKSGVTFIRTPPSKSEKTFGINLPAMFNSIDIKNLKNEPEKSIAELVKNKLEGCQSIKTGTGEQIQNLWDFIFEIEFLLTQIFSGIC